MPIIKIIFLGSILLLVACSSGDDSSTSSNNKFAYCNSRSNNLSEYAECRCRQITGAKSWTKEMDDCSVDPKVYAEGYEGEIPQRIRDKMNE